MRLVLGHIYAGKKTIAVEKDGMVKFYHKDHLGSTRVVTDAAGAKIAEYKFAPYGEKELSTGEGTEYGFTDKAEDVTTGLKYFGARFYDAEVGRFLTFDPKENSFKLDKPQTQNRYSYCWNYPIKLLDPDGKAPIYMMTPGIDGGGSGARDQYNSGNYKGSGFELSMSRLLTEFDNPEKNGNKLMESKIDVSLAISKDEAGQKFASNLGATHTAVNIVIDTLITSLSASVGFEPGVGFGLVKAAYDIFTAYTGYSPQKGDKISIEITTKVYEGMSFTEVTFGVTNTDEDGNEYTVVDDTTVDL